MKFGDRIRIEMFDRDGRSIFGAIDQVVEQPPADDRVERASLERQRLRRPQEDDGPPRGTFPAERFARDLDHRGRKIDRRHVRGLLEQGNKKVLVNLGGVDYVDSSGIGELVSCYTTTKNQGGQLKLLNLTKKIKDLLQITKLLTVFETFDSEDEALRSYKS